MNSSYIESYFEQLREQKKKAFIPFITACDPDRNTSLGLMKMMVKEGADLIEIGVPFSDPGADGRPIQNSYARAIKNGVNLQQVFLLISAFRVHNNTTPIILMTYLNPIEKMGYESFIKQAKACKVNAVLVVDMPLEESDRLYFLMRKSNLDMIFPVSPTTSESRLKKILERASGFIYYISVKGITDSQMFDPKQLSDKIKWIRNHTFLPICVGFGIKTNEQLKIVQSLADGAIVGSTLVKIINTHEKDSTSIQTMMKNTIKGLLTNTS